MKINKERFLICTSFSGSSLKDIERHNLNALLISSEKFDLNVKVLWTNNSFIDMFESKINNTYKYLLDLRKQYDYIMYVDGSDILMASDIDEIINKYETFDSDLLFGYFPNFNLDDVKENGSGFEKSDFIDTGCFIGSIDKIIYLFEKTIIEDTIYKHGFRHNIYIRNIVLHTLKKYSIQYDIDYNEDIFFNCFIPQFYKLSICENRIRIINKGSSPCVFHLQESAYGLMLSLYHFILNGNVDYFNRLSGFAISSNIVGMENIDRPNIEDEVFYWAIRSKEDDLILDNETLKILNNKQVKLFDSYYGGEQFFTVSNLEDPYKLSFIVFNKRVDVYLDREKEFHSFGAKLIKKEDDNNVNGFIFYVFEHGRVVYENTINLYGFCPNFIKVKRMILSDIVFGELE